MTKRTETITLEGNSYTIHAFNLGELEELAELFDAKTATTKTGLQMLKLALRRSEPPVKDVSLMEPTREEISSAMDTIARLAGLKNTAANPPATPVAS